MGFTILHLLKLAVAISGVANIILGVLILATGNYSITSNDGEDLAIALITIGSIVFITTLFFCYITSRENFYTLLCLAAFLVLFAVGDLAISVTASQRQNSHKGSVHMNLKDAEKRYLEGDSKAERDWAQVHKHLRCCGTDGPHSWLADPDDKESHNALVPMSCCQAVTVEGPRKECKIGSVNNGKSCIDKLSDVIKNNLNIMNKAGIVMALVEAAEAALVLMLAKKFRKTESN